MKKLCMIIGLLLFEMVVSAQGGGLTFSQSAGTYTPIGGGTVLVSTTFDDANYPVTLPASFTFKGTAYTQVVVNTNGWIALGSTAPANNLYAPISTTTAVPGFIAPFGMDIENADGGSPEIRWEQSGNEIIFQWKDVKRYTSATNTEIFSFQLRLNTSTGTVQFVYGDFQNITTSTSFPQVGIRAETNAYPGNIYNRLVNTTLPSTTWATSVDGVTNSSTCRITSSSPAVSPVSGQTFTWTPADCTSLTCTSNVLPANGSTINSTSVNLSWNAVSGTYFYRLYMGTSLPLTLVGTYSGTTATINNLVTNTNYSWYVAPAGFNCSVSGCESTATSFNSGCPILNCVTNLSPANGSSTTNGNITFSWNSTPGATNYDLYLGTSNPPTLYGNYTTTSVNIVVIPGTYFWYVVPKSACNEATGCETNITSFTYSSPVPNDICQTATNLSGFIGTVVSTAGGTTEGLSFPGACAGGSRDIWYKFRAIATTASVSVSGSGSPCYDPGIQAFSGSCSSLTCLGNDDAGSCTTLNTVSLSGLSIGNIYYIRIYSTSSGGGQFAINGTNIGSILPLNLISFTGSSLVNDAVLQWKTANEVNVSHFELQRSEDGTNFVTVATIPAGATSYSHTDAGIFNRAEKVYYRLKSADIDGRFTLSAIIRLQKQQSGSITAYPNPVKDALTIVGFKTGGAIELFSASGQLLHRLPVMAQTITLSTATLQTGLYLLQYKNGEEIQIVKFIKQ